MTEQLTHTSKIGRGKSAPQVSYESITNEEREDVESEGQSLGLGSQLFALYSSTGDSPSLISVAY